MNYLIIVFDFLDVSIKPFIKYINSPININDANHPTHPS